MLSRNEVEAMGYAIDDLGRVANPGKFEGEHWSTIALWDVVMNGFQDETFYDEDDSPLDVIALKDEDRITLELPDLQGESNMETITHVLLWENESGFVQSDWLSQEEYDAFVEKIEGED